MESLAGRDQDGVSAEPADARGQPLHVLAGQQDGHRAAQLRGQANTFTNELGCCRRELFAGRVGDQQHTRHAYTSLASRSLSASLVPASASESASISSTLASRISTYRRRS